MLESAMPAKAHSPKAQSLNIQAAFVKATPGACMYREINDQGEPRLNDDDDSTFGNFYVRKKQLKRLTGSDKIPDYLTITVHAVGV